MKKQYLTAKDVLIRLARDHWELKGISREEIRELTGFKTESQKRNYYRALEYFFKDGTELEAEDGRSHD